MTFNISWCEVLFIAYAYVNIKVIADKQEIIGYEYRHISEGYSMCNTIISKL